jgi:hypothetical protein
VEHIASIFKTLITTYKTINHQGGWDLRVWIGFIWLRIRPGGGLFWPSCYIKGEELLD